MEHFHYKFTVCSPSKVVRKSAPRLRVVRAQGVVIAGRAKQFCLPAASCRLQSEIRSVSVDTPFQFNDPVARIIMAGFTGTYVFWHIQFIDI